VPSRLRATLFGPRGACARFVRILSRRISSTNGVYDHSLRRWVPCALRLVPATSVDPDARNIGTPCDRKCDQRDRADHENDKCSYEDFQHDRTRFRQLPLPTIDCFVSATLHTPGSPIIGGRRTTLIPQNPERKVCPDNNRSDIAHWSQGLEL
jgi:hypothetical protein